MFKVHCAHHFRCFQVICLTVVLAIFSGLPTFAGKSNLMDAVSFVLGGKIVNQRARSLDVSMILFTLPA